LTADSDGKETREVTSKQDLPHKRRFVRRLVVVIVILAGVWACVWWFGAHGGAAKLAEARREAAAAGLPLSIDDFLAKYPPPDEEDNAANIYESAIAAFMYVGGNEPQADCVPLVSRVLNRPVEYAPPDLALAARDNARITDDPRTPIPDYMLTATKTYVSHRAEVIDLIHKATAFRRCRYHIHWDGFVQQLWHLTRIREMLRLVALAVWVDAEENRPGEAAVKIRDMLTLTRSPEEDASLATPGVEAACAAITLSTALTRLVARTTLTSEDLTAIQTDLERFDAEYSPRRACEGELACWAGMSDEFISGRSRLWDFAQSFGQALPPESKDRVYQWPPWLISSRLRTEEALTIRYYTYLAGRINRMSLDPPAPGKEDPMLSEIDGSRYALAKMALMFPRMLGNQPALMRARLRAAAAAMAALRFKNDHGRLPASPDELVPEYMAQMPLDPFSGTLLLFKLVDDGLIIYSIGEDRTDDVSKGYVPGRRTSAHGDDVGFTIWTGAAPDARGK